MTIQKTRTRSIPPDGGWGWAVLISAMVVNFLIPGTVKSFGVLFVEFLQVFQASSAAAAWMPALCYFLYNSLGPLSSILSTKYSYRTVTLIGGTFAASGMMLSYFANSVTYLYVSYGLMVGIGAGLSFPPTVYIVTAYFERLRGFANGLCISGSAIGTIVLPPFFQYLLDTFGYRGAVVIMGAITLNTLICAMFYHPVEEHMKIVTIEIDQQGIDNEALTMDDEKKSSSLVEESNLDANAIISDKDVVEKQMESVPTTKLSPISLIDNELPKIYKEIFLQESSKPPKLSKNEKRKNKKNKKIKTMTKEHKFFDFSVLRDPIFLIILISNTTSAISNTNFMILLPSYAISQGYDKNVSALLLSIVSALDLVGRIGGASLSDINFVPKYYYFVSGLGLSGIALALLPMANSYAMLSFFCALFGLSSGVYIGITTVILADMLGTEKLSSSYGISLFVNGVLQLIGPPICGSIFERIGTYKPIFLGLGIILIMGTALWGLMPIINRSKKKNLEIV